MSDGQMEALAKAARRYLFQEYGHSPDQVGRAAQELEQALVLRVQETISRAPKGNAMSLAERIQGAKLTGEERGSAQVGAHNRTEPSTDGGYRFVAEAQHAKDKSELLWAIVYELEERFGSEAADWLGMELQALNIPRPKWPEWAS